MFGYEIVLLTPPNNEIYGLEFFIQLLSLARYLVLSFFLLAPLLARNVVLRFFF